MSNSRLLAYDINFKGMNDIELCKSFMSYPAIVSILTKEYLGVASTLPSSAELKVLKDAINKSNVTCDKVMFNLVLQNVFHLSVYHDIYIFLGYINNFLAKHKKLVTNSVINFINSLTFNLGLVCGGLLEDGEDFINFSLKVTDASDECESWFANGIPDDIVVCNIITFNNKKEIIEVSNVEFFKN